MASRDQGSTGSLGHGIGRWRRGCLRRSASRGSTVRVTSCCPTAAAGGRLQWEAIGTDGGQPQGDQPRALWIETTWRRSRDERAAFPRSIPCSQAARLRRRGGAEVNVNDGPLDPRTRPSGGVAGRSCASSGGVKGRGVVGHGKASRSGIIGRRTKEGIRQGHRWLAEGDGP